VFENSRPSGFVCLLETQFLHLAGRTRPLRIRFD